MKRTIFNKGRKHKVILKNETGNAMWFNVWNGEDEPFEICIRRESIGDNKKGTKIGLLSP